MWAFARQELSLSSEEFWSLTWREVAALSDVLRGKIQREDARTALIRHTLLCLWSNNPPTFDELMPSYGPENHSKNGPAKPSNRPLTDDEMTAKVGIAMRALGCKQE